MYQVLLLCNNMMYSWMNLCVGMCGRWFNFSGISKNIILWNKAQAELCLFVCFYMPFPLPYFKVNICPFPLPHFASICFAYLWSFRWPNYTLRRYNSFRLPHLNIPTWAPLRRIGHEYSGHVAWSTFQSLKRILPPPDRSKLI